MCGRLGVLAGSQSCLTKAMYEIYSSYDIMS